MGREAKTAKDLRYCRERDRIQDRMNRILYANMKNRYLERLDKEWREKASSVAARKFEAQGKYWKKRHKHNKNGLLSKPQCLPAAILLVVWDRMEEKGRNEAGRERKKRPGVEHSVTRRHNTDIVKRNRSN